MMAYFLVKCKFGHVGRNMFLPMYVPVEASDSKEASRIAWLHPGVKKQHKDWCLEVPEEIDYHRYVDELTKYRQDIYWQKKTRSRLNLFKERLVKEMNYTRIRDVKTNKKLVNKAKAQPGGYKLKRYKEYIGSLEPMNDEYLL